MKKAYKYLAWFLAGQIAQIILHLVSKTNYMMHPVLFCGAAGFLLTVCVYAGARITREKMTELTYMDYAEGRHE